MGRRQLGPPHPGFFVTEQGPKRKALADCHHMFIGEGVGLRSGVRAPPKIGSGQTILRSELAE